LDFCQTVRGGVGRGFNIFFNTGSLPRPAPHRTNLKHLKIENPNPHVRGPWLFLKSHATHASLQMKRVTISSSSLGLLALDLSTTGGGQRLRYVETTAEIRVAMKNVGKK
jgi:hypothetical protein